MPKIARDGFDDRFTARRINRRAAHSARPRLRGERRWIRNGGELEAYRGGGVYGPVTFSSRKSGCCMRVNSTAKPLSMWRTTRLGVLPSVISVPISGT